MYNTSDCYGPGPKLPTERGGKGVILHSYVIYVTGGNVHEDYKRYRLIPLVIYKSEPKDGLSS